MRLSRKFARLLELILLFGNFMNAGSRNEQTFGFELSFVAKVFFSVIYVYSRITAVVDVHTLHERLLVRGFVA